MGTGTGRFYRADDRDHPLCRLGLHKVLRRNSGASVAQTKLEQIIKAFAFGIVALALTMKIAKIITMQKVAKMRWKSFIRIGLFGSVLII